MTDDAKEWVTIKVPKADREQAKDYRPDGATYGDCLVAGSMVLGGEGEPIYQPGSAEPVEWIEGIEGDVEIEPIYPDAEEIAEAVTASLDLDAGDGPDFDALAREVARRIDYAMLASKVADELEGRIR